ISPVSSRTIKISSPATTSGLSVDASASSGKTDAGRKLANKLSSLRSLRSADRAEQDGVGGSRQLQRRPGQRISGCVVRRASNGGLLHLELETFSPQRCEHLDRLGNDLGADAVAGQDRNFHEEEMTNRTTRAVRRGAVLRRRGSCPRGAE